MKKLIANGYLWALLLVMYSPIFIILIFSFTDAKALGSWHGFTTDLYANLFKGEAGPSLNSAIATTAIVAIISALISTLLGSLAAIGIFNMRAGARRAMNFVNQIPMINPDIITGTSIFLLFVAIGLPRGIVSVICAHVAFCMPYVVLSVMPRLMKMNPNLYEAAIDLGATPFIALRKVIFPELKPGMLSGFILALTLSIDDFAVTLFTKGSDGLNTISTFIYIDARKGGLTPELRPLFSIIFITILVLLIILNLRAAKQTANKK
ncbi:MAG: ABC transporter permease [Bacteroidales bacterium]|nr:ABC transporter permease [Bacteroidales bacterium]